MISIVRRVCLLIMSDCSPHQYLYENLIVLNELKPGGSDFVKCIKDDMFTKPNRTAFDQVLFYLCNAYDSVRYMPKVPWPILDRSQERTFRQNTVAFVKEIIKEVPQARIPQFSPSFLSTPGGERLAKFMWKLSLLVLKTVVERESDFVGILHYPTAPAVVPLVESMTESILLEIGKESNDLCQLLIDSSKYAKKLNNEILNQSIEKNRLKNELSEMIQGMERCPLSEMDKSLILNSGREEFMSIIAKWQHLLNKEAEEAKSMLKALQAQSTAVKDCYESVQVFVNSKTMPVVLDASNFPANLKDNNGYVDLAHLITEGAKSATNILKSLSMFGGFQCYELVQPELKSIREKFQEAETSFAETKAGFIELLSASLETMRSPKKINGGLESPLLKGGLQIGNEMLQDAQTNTPPLVFDVHCDISSRICTESSPVDGVVGRMRPFSRVKPNVETSSTPKASLSNSTSGLSIRNLSGKVPHIKSLSQNGPKTLKSSPKLSFYEPLSTVAETPANFCSKQFATSTAYKPSTLAPLSYKAKLALAKPKVSTNGFDKKCSLKTLKGCSPSKSHALGTELHQAANCNVVSKVIPSSNGDNEAKSPLLFKDKAEEKLTKIPISKEGSFKKLKPQYSLEEATLTQADKEVIHSRSSVGAKEENSVLTANLRSSSILQTSQEVISSVLSSPLHKTPQRSQHASMRQSCTNNDVPKIMVNAVGDSFVETFDSPQSSSFGVLSPPSADNSFFSTDMHSEIMVDAPPKFDLDDFGDDISPSGRVSLCPPDVQESEIVTEIAAPAKENSRRQSLQAIIHRYRELVASSKQHEVKVALPSSPEIDPSPEDVPMDLEISFGDIELN